MSEIYWNYLIGDIHGCYDELIALEKKIINHAKRNNVKPFIISVGDLVDRGNKSAEVVEHFRHGYYSGTHFAVMGNHELLMIEALEAFAPHNFYRDGCEYPSWFYNYQLNYQEGRGLSRYLSWDDYKIMTKGMWLSQGGFTTLLSYGCDPHVPDSWFIPDNTLQFLINLPFFYEGDNFITTHALAIKSDLSFSMEIIQNISNNQLNLNDPISLRNAVHSLVWNRTIPSEPINDKLHISGHTPLNRVKRNKKAASLQIDTACVFGGKLTAFCVEADKFISVKANRNYLE